MINLKVIISSVVLLGVIITLLINVKFIPGIQTDLPILPIIIGIKLLLIFLVLGYFLNTKRLYVYGILVSGAFSFSEIIIHQTDNLQIGAIPFLIASIIMVIVGSTLFAQFLKKYPLPKEEEHA